MDLGLLSFQAETLLPTEFGEFNFRVYQDSDGREVIAVFSQGLDVQQHVPVRVHSACFTSEVMGSLKCDCKQQLEFALRYISEHGGVVLYLPQEGRGIGLANKIRAYALQEHGYDTIDANHLLGLPIDDRRYDAAAWILKDLGVDSLMLMTNNPEKLAAMRALGLQVSGRIPVTVESTDHSQSYLETKRLRMGHWLDIRASDISGGPNPAVGAKRLRPFIHVNFAIDEQGRTSARNGQPLPLSCSMDWKRVHQLRERYTAIAVGARTWLQDKPRLTARREKLGREPVRQPEMVVFAGSSACLINDESRRSFVIGSGRNQNGGATHITADDHDLRGPLQTLFRHGVSSVLVEGGRTLLGSFVSQEMVDRVTVYVRTQSEAQAVGALKKALPELVRVNGEEQIEASRFGEGILLIVGVEDRPHPGALPDRMQAAFSQGGESAR